MMDAVSTTITVLCASLFSASLLKLLVPTGSTEKIMKLVLSIFILISIVSSVSSVVKSFDYSVLSNDDEVSDTDTLTSAVDENVLKATAEYLAQYLDSILVASNIDVDKITVTVKASESGVINVDSVCIYMDVNNTKFSQSVSDIVEDAFGITPEIINRSSNE